MIEFQNVNYIVKDGTIDKEIIKDISFKLPSCGMVVLSGKSGSGKTTILNLITNTIKKSSGKIFFDGHDYDTKKRSEIDLIRKNDISVVYQNEGLIEDLTIEENLKVCLCAKGIAFSDVKGLYEQYIEMLGLSMCLNTKAYNLSGGERVRVRILQAIIVEPKVLILDEPTASLDLENSKIVMEFLNSIKDKILIVLSTHDLELLDGYEYSIIKINYGRIEYINILDTTLNQKDELKRGKTNIKYISKKVFRQKNIRVVLNTVLLCISMVLVMLPCMMAFYNKADFFYNAYKTIDYDTYIISSVNYERMYTDMNTIYYDNFDTHKYKKLKFREFNYQAYEIIGNIKNNIIVDNDIQTNGIVLTDYMIYMMKENGLVKKDVSIGSTINLSGNDLVIVDVVETNYLWYLSLDKNNMIVEGAYVDIYYKNIFLNEEYAKKLMDSYDDEEAKYRKNNFVCVDLSDEKESRKLLEYLYKQKYEVISPYDDDIKNSLKEYLMILKFNKYLFPLELTMMVISMYYLIVSLLNSNRKKLGLLKSYGMNNSQIIFAMDYKFIGNLILSYASANVLYLIYFFWTNKFIIKSTQFNDYIIPYNYLGLIFYTVIFALISAVLLYISKKKLDKKDILDLLKK